MDAREELLTALNEYEGTVVLISHDRRLIEGCADRLLLVAEGRVAPYDGDLEDYKRFVLSRGETSNGAPQRDERDSKAGQRRAAAEKRLNLKPLKDAVSASERDIAEIIGKIETIDQALAAPGLFAKDPAKGQALSKQRAELGRALRRRRKPLARSRRALRGGDLAQPEKWEPVFR